MMDDTDRPTGSRATPTRADVLSVLVWLTKDGHETAKQRLADILRSDQDGTDSVGVTDLERLRISSVLANAQIRTLLTAVADSTVDVMVDRSSVPAVAALAGISESMISRRRSRARSRQSAKNGDGATSS